MSYMSEKIEPDPMQIHGESLNIECIIEHPQWSSVDLDVEEYVTEVVCKTLTHIKYFDKYSTAEISVLLACDERLQELNSDFRHNDKPTNVLSFPNYEIYDADYNSIITKNDPFLGDIAISYNTIYNESIEQDKSLKDHFTHMLIHGVLHLLGFDHQDDQNATKMENLEIKILQKYFNINNPYIVQFND